MIYPITIAGRECTVEYDYEITTRPFKGVGASLTDPGEPPYAGEFDIDITGLVTKNHLGLRVNLELPMWLRQSLRRAIAEDSEAYDAVMEDAGL